MMPPERDAERCRQLAERIRRLPRYKPPRKPDGAQYIVREPLHAAAHQFFVHEAPIKGSVVRYKNRTFEKLANFFGNRWEHRRIMHQRVGYSRQPRDLGRNILLWIDKRLERIHKNPFAEFEHAYLRHPVRPRRVSGGLDVAYYKIGFTKEHWSMYFYKPTSLGRSFLQYSCLRRRANVDIDGIGIFPRQSVVIHRCADILPRKMRKFFRTTAKPHGCYGGLKRDVSVRRSIE